MTFLTYGERDLLECGFHDQMYRRYAALSIFLNFMSSLRGLSVLNTS
jgi:hypothetical protein